MIDDVIPTAVTCLKEESQAILDLIPRIDEKFNKIIDLVHYHHSVCESQLKGQQAQVLLLGTSNKQSLTIKGSENKVVIM